MIDHKTAGSLLLCYVDPFEHPDAQRRFRVMANVEELERALDFPWEKWTVFLHPEPSDKSLGHDPLLYFPVVSRT